MSSLWSKVWRQVGDIADGLLADETYSELERARDFLSSDPEAAAAMAADIVREHPDHAVAIALWATAEIELGHYERAAEKFDEALALDFDLAEALLGRGEAALALGRPEDATLPYGHAVEVAGGNRGILAAAYRGLGFALLRRGELDKAIRELRKAVAENSGDVVSRAILGWALLERGETDEARRHLRRTGSGDTRPVAALYALGILHLREGDHRRALELLGEALERFAPGPFVPSESEIIATQAEARVAAQDWAGARDDFERALAGHPRRGWLLARLADVHVAAGEIDEALDRFRRSLEIEERVDVFERALALAIANRRIELAALLGGRLLAIAPEHPRALVAQALHLADQGQTEAARVLLRTAASAGGDVFVHLAFARLDEADGDLERAAEHVLAGLRLAPRSSEARAALQRVRDSQLRRDTPGNRGSAEAAWQSLGERLVSLLATRPELAGLAPEAAAAASDFDRPLLVTVMGEFSSGKSSFINAFIGEEIAPMGITPTTATINVVRYGRERGGRILYRDGSSEEIPWDELTAKLKQVSGRAAGSIAHVEILLPLEFLERVHLVDTPGLNSILPEHEQIARDFIARADAIVWLFSAGQAGKKSERGALAEIHKQGKKVLGVLNKIDQLADEQIAEVREHIALELGELVDTLVCVSARAALETIRSGDEGDAQFEVLKKELDERFFARAREIKRAALDRRMAEVEHRAKERLMHARASDDEDGRVLRDAVEHVDAECARFAGEVASRERATMHGEIEQLFRGAADEVLELVRPRRLPFGSHQTSPADRDYLIGLLAAGYRRVIGACEQRVCDELTAVGRRALAAVATLRGSTADPASDIERTISDAIRWVRADVFGRTTSYVEGYLRGGYVRDFFQRDLPKLELERDVVFTALYQSSPDIDSVIGDPLSRASTFALQRLSERLTYLADVAELHGFDLDVGIGRALETIAEERESLTSDGAAHEDDPGDR